ncbi:MAG: aldo/keto reductase [Candidatus Zixiibacteriota bacterium]|nr:MAG: aldo/keto reductase [candidate division Zixibacteria bacterium]
MTNRGPDLNRRKFLSATTAGLVSAGLVKLVPSCSEAKQETPADDDSGKEMICRKLGRTGYEVPIVGFGIMNASNPELVHAACEAGVRYFNASAGYQFGRIEEHLGRAVNRLKIRDKVVIATSEFDYNKLRGISPVEVKRKMITSCEGSLRRLGTDYIDIFYVYEADNPRDINDQAVIESLMALKDQGKIRYTGVTTHSNMAHVIEGVTRNGFFDLVLTSINFTMADDTKLLKAISDAAAKGVAVVGMKVMAGGTRWPNPESRKNYSSSTIAKACLKWVMRNENIATCIPGFVNFEHMRQDLSVAYDLEYTEEEAKFVSDNGIKLGIGFCRQCRKCLASCPEGVDIPTLMRTHMYAAQYGDFYKARATIDGIPSASGLKACARCSSCQARCASTVDITHRVDELKTIYA